MCPLDRWPRSCCPLGPEAQDRPSFCPDSFLRVENDPLPNPPLLSPWQPRFRLFAQEAGDTCHRPAVPARAGSPALRPFPGHKANGSFSSPGAACCTFPRPAPGERSDRHVPFLKAVSTGATTLLSQAEGTPIAPYGYLPPCCADSLRPAAVASANPTLISQRMLCFRRGDAQAKRLSLYAGFSHRETGPRQAAAAARRTDCDFSANAVLSQRLWAWSELHFAAASTARLRSRQGRRGAGEPVPLGICFPGLQVRAQGSPCQAELSRHSENTAAASVA